MSETKEMNMEIKTGMHAMLNGFGNRLWRVEDICIMEDGTTRYKVLNMEPADGGFMGGGYASTRRLVARSELNVIVESIEQPAST